MIVPGSNSEQARKGRPSLFCLLRKLSKASTRLRLRFCRWGPQSNLLNFLETAHLAPDQLKFCYMKSCWTQCSNAAMASCFITAITSSFVVTWPIQLVWAMFGHQNTHGSITCWQNHAYSKTPRLEVSHMLGIPKYVRRRARSSRSTKPLTFDKTSPLGSQSPRPPNVLEKRIYTTNTGTLASLLR